MCTFSKLFWKENNVSECSGETSMIGTLFENVDDYLQNLKCKSDQSINLGELLLNRLTPHYISIETLSAVDICKFHLDKNTKKSRFFKITSCEIPNCEKSVERRVTSRTSSQLFAVWNHHIPIGAGLCASHRKKLTAAVKSSVSVEEVLQESIVVDEAPRESMIVEKVPQQSINLEISDEDLFDDQPSSPVKSSLIKEEENALFPGPPSPLPRHYPKRPRVQKATSFCSDSQGSDSQEVKPLSQISNFSDSSDIEVRKEVTRIEECDKMAKLEILQPFFKAVGLPSEVNLSGIIDGNSSEHQLISRGKLVSDVVQALCKILVTRREPGLEEKLLESVAHQVLDGVLGKKVSLGLAVLEDLKSYFSALRKDSTRDSVVMKKILMEGFTGPNITANNLLSQLADCLAIRKPSLYASSKQREKFDDNQELVKIVSRLERKPPEGTNVISLEWNLKAVGFYEEEEISDMVKGCSNVFKERTKSSDGSGKAVLLRQKRILKVSPLLLLNQAKLSINWPFSLSSLLRMRPSWILLPSSRYLLGCLCEICHNLALLIRCLNTFIVKGRSCGSKQEKIVLQDIHPISSTSSLIEMILHPIEPGKSIHNRKCFDQSCDQSSCGKAIFDSIFGVLIEKLGHVHVELFQHVQIPYTTKKGVQAKKYELQKLDVALAFVFTSISERIFDNKNDYLTHLLDKELGRMARHDVRTGLGDYDLIIYSDFSKEYEIRHDEQLKGEGFGPSHKTYRMIPQVGEAKVMVPSEPRHVVLDTSLKFESPQYHGGSNIQCYEVDIEDPVTKIWYLFFKIDVKYLSPEADIPKDLFGSLDGQFKLRIYARNLAGRGDPAELVAILSGRSPFNPSKYVEIEEAHFVQQYHTYWQEFHYISDHEDAPKDWRSIGVCNVRTLQSMQTDNNRRFTRVFHYTDRGGENWGSQALSVYSWSQEDLGLQSVWCPTPANHSGQPSDSAGGIIKRRLNRHASAGNLKGITTAKSLVEFLEEQPMFQETNQKRYLCAITTKRSYHNLTRSEVDQRYTAKLLEGRTVKQLKGVSAFKQAFSLGKPNELLVRKNICCCSDCLNNNFDLCKNQEYVETPVKVTFKFANPSQVQVESTDSREFDDPNAVKIGSIYAVKRNEADSGDGFDLVKCENFNDLSMMVTYLEKCPGAEKHCQFYRETDSVEEIGLERLHTGLITIYLVESLNVYSVCNVELEDILFSINC